MTIVTLFVNGAYDSASDRSVVPRVGETIIIDCGFAVKVIEVVHQWDTDDYVQVNTERLVIQALDEEDEGEQDG